MFCQVDQLREKINESAPFTARWRVSGVGDEDAGVVAAFGIARFDAEGGAEGATHERLQRAFPAPYVHRPAPIFNTKDRIRRRRNVIKLEKTDGPRVF